MKIKFGILTGFVLIFALQCSVDDANRRFHESRSLPSPAAISVNNLNNFTFIHLTDIHVLKERNRHLSAIKSKLVSSDAFIIISGDLTENGQREDFIAYRNILNATGIPYLSGIGNHDIFFSGWEFYKKILGPSVYSTTAGNIRIIVLDSAGDTLGPDQYEWLKNELKAKTETFCLVVTHYNFFSPTFFESAQSSNMEEVYGMMRLFEQYHVNFVLMGHSHIYDFQNINGIGYVVGSAFKEYTDNEQRHFIRFTVNNGQMSFQRLPLY